MRMTGSIVTAARIAAVLMVAGLLGMGCVPIDMTKTITISTDTHIFEALTPGAEIPGDFAPDSIALCEQIPEEYRDVDQFIQNLLAGVGLEFLADYIDIESLEVTRVALEVAEDGGSFEGLTEISASVNGEYVAIATPGDGISATEIVLEPDSPIDALSLLEECPMVTGAIRGAVPLDPPTKWDNLITLHLKARIGLS